MNFKNDSLSLKYIKIIEDKLLILPMYAVHLECFGEGSIQYLFILRFPSGLNEIIKIEMGFCYYTTHKISWIFFIQQKNYPSLLHPITAAISIIIIIMIIIIVL